MKVAGYPIISLAMLLSVGIADSSQSEDAKKKSRGASIHEKLDEKRKAASEYYRFVEIELSVKTYYPKGGLNMRSQKSSSPIPKADFNGESRISLLYSPEGHSAKYTIFSNNPNPSADNSALTPFTFHETYLAKEDKLVSRRIVEGGKSVLTPTTSQTPFKFFENVQVQPLVRSLGFDQKWLRFPNSEPLYVEDTTINGRECHHLKYEFPDLGSVRLYLERGSLNIVREARIDENGLLTRQLDIEYTQDKDHRHPKTWSESRFVNGNLSRRCVTTVERLNRLTSIDPSEFLNPPKPGDRISAEKPDGSPYFAIIRKDGKEVEIKGNDRLVPDDVQEAKVNAGLSQHWLFRNWVWLLPVFLVPLLCLAIRNRYRRSNSVSSK